MAKEESGKKCELCNGCGGGHCLGHWHWHTLLRWVLGLVIIVMVFKLGIKVGELKSLIMGSGNLGYYQTGSYYDNNPLVPGGMMSGRNYYRGMMPVLPTTQTTVSPETIVTPVTSTTPKTPTR